MNEKIWQKKSVAGPSSYSAGGFDVTMDRLVRVEEATVYAYPPDNRGGLILFGTEITMSGNTVTVVVKEVDVTDGAQLAWTETADATDLFGITFVVDAVGY